MDRKVKPGAVLCKCSILRRAAHELHSISCFEEPSFAKPCLLSDSFSITLSQPRQRNLTWSSSRSTPLAQTAWDFWEQRGQLHPTSTAWPPKVWSLNTPTRKRPEPWYRT